MELSKELLQRLYVGDRPGFLNVGAVRDAAIAFGFATESPNRTYSEWRAAWTREEVQVWNKTISELDKLYPMWRGYMPRDFSNGARQKKAVRHAA
ncbi:MAG: hypothetical protein ACRC62_15480 [Microcoleus sp.]